MKDSEENRHFSADFVVQVLVRSWKDHDQFDECALHDVHSKANLDMGSDVVGMIHNMTRYDCVFFHLGKLMI